jgi:phytanoyl-CoA hydroxylase
VAGLDNRQISFFKEEGYLLLDKLLPPAACQPLVDEFNAAIDQKARAAQAKGHLPDLFEGAPFKHRLARICEAMGTGKQFAGEILGKRHKTAGLFHLLTHPSLLDVVESLIGPEILVHPQFNLRAKMPGEVEVEWHQDIAFLAKEVEQTLMVNFWIPLVDTDVENGCLEIVAGSHRHGIVTHEKASFEQVILENNVPGGARILSVLPAGGAALLQHKTVHRSFPNLSDHIRWSLDIRYSDPRKPTGRAHVPGFIARSRENPDGVAKSHLDWLELMADKPEV